MVSNPKISIIIPTFNRENILIETLYCIFKLPLKLLNIEVIVVNDGHDFTNQIPKFENCLIVKNPKQGAASARNLGASLATGETLIFIDDDISISEENILATLDFIEKHPGACLNLNWKYSEDTLNYCHQSAFGRFIINTKLINYQGWVQDIDWKTVLFETHKLCAFYFVIPKQLFHDCEGFDENFKNQGVEDDEFSFRLKNRNVPLFIEPNQYVLHNETDKIDLINRLNRFKIGAVNKRQALEMGMKEYYIAYPFYKKCLYTLLLKFKKPLISLCRKIPNRKEFDFISFKIFHLLIGIVIFEGYYKQDRSTLKLNHA